LGSQVPGFKILSSPCFQKKKKKASAGVRKPFVEVTGTERKARQLWVVGVSIFFYWITDLLIPLVAIVGVSPRPEKRGIFPP
jgi:hypothetical protein